MLAYPYIMRLIAAFLLLLLTLSITGQAQTRVSTELSLEAKSVSADALSDTNKNYAALLLAIEARRDSVRAELDRMRRFHDREVDQVLRRLDAFWTSGATGERFTAHYKRVEKILSEVEIRGEHSNLDVIVNQYRALFDEAPLRKICEDFTADAFQKIQEEQERFFTSNEEAFSRAADIAFGEAQASLAKQVDAAIANQFPAWQRIYATLPVELVNQAKLELDAGDARDNRGTFAVLGLAVLALSRVVRRVLIRRVTRKLVGRVVSRFIPYVGLALLAFEAATALQAKNRMEKFLRETFMTEYQVMVSQGALWKEVQEDQSLRELTRTQVDEQLTAWSKASRETTEELLIAAPLLENPNFKSFAQRKIKEGTDVTLLAKELNLLYGTFGHLCLTAPMDKLIEMRFHVRDEGTRTARVLAETLGDELLPLYEREGADLLKAAQDMGPEPVLHLLRQGQEWRPTWNAYRRHLDASASTLARSGFFLANELNMPLSSDWLPARFEQLAANEGTLRMLADRGLEGSALSDIGSDPNLSDTLLRVAEQDSDLAVALAGGLEPLQLARYREADQREALLKTYVSLRQREDWTPETFVTQIRRSDRIIGIYDEYGEDGLELYGAYVSNRTGRHQERLLDKALSLYRQGMPVEVCKDQRNIGMANAFYAIPGGATIFDLFYPILVRAPLIGRILAALFCVGLFLFVWRVLRLRRLFGFGKKKRA